MRFLLLIICAAGLISCSEPAEFKPGTWRGVIEMQGQQLPFNFEVIKATFNNGAATYRVALRNAEEKIILDEVNVSGDSVRMVLHIFDAELVAKIHGRELTGYYVKNFVKDYRLPFYATLGEDFRFAKVSDAASVDFSGKYSLRFANGADTTVSVGIFRQTGSRVAGTFLNPDGDYRYLEGNVVADKLWLSTFDGHHAYLFSATLKDNAFIFGDYWSGKAHHETWSGEKNENAKLPDPESLTFLKPGYEKLEFSFPDVEGKRISPSDDRYKDKVLILQIFGTWCPNCMDETKFLAEWYPKNKDRGVELIGLAYEQKADFEYASSRIKKMKTKLGVNYDFVVAGTSDKMEASKTLPALNRIMAFPTTIFIGKDGKVKKIDTGFSGPGTGIYYEQYKERFSETINELLGEKLTSTTGK